MPERDLLMIPGLTMVDPAVLRAMSAPVMAYNSPEFVEIAGRAGSGAFRHQSCAVKTRARLGVLLRLRVGIGHGRAHGVHACGPLHRIAARQALRAILHHDVHRSLYASRLHAQGQKLPVWLADERASA